MSVIIVKRNLPSDKMKSFDGIRHVSFPDGRVVTYTEDMGFMAMFYFISTYEPRKSIFGKTTFHLIKKIEVDDDKDKAEKLFAFLTQQ